MYIAIACYSTYNTYYFVLYSQKVIKLLFFALQYIIDILTYVTGLETCHVHPIATVLSQ